MYLQNSSQNCMYTHVLYIVYHSHSAVTRIIFTVLQKDIAAFLAWKVHYLYLQVHYLRT